MRCCSAIGCSNLSRKSIKGVSGVKLTHHKFPFSRPLILKRWILNMRRANWYPNQHSSLCSTHFEPDCYDPKFSNPRLKLDAVPTIFNFPETLGEVGKKEKKTVRNTEKEEVAPEVNDNSSTSVSVSNYQPLIHVIKSDNIVPPEICDMSVQTSDCEDKNETIGEPPNKVNVSKEPIKSSGACPLTSSRNCNKSGAKMRGKIRRNNKYAPCLRNNSITSTQTSDSAHYENGINQDNDEKDEAANAPAQASSDYSSLSKQTSEMNETNVHDENENIHNFQNEEVQVPLQSPIARETSGRAASSIQQTTDPIETDLLINADSHYHNFYKTANNDLVDMENHNYSLNCKSMGEKIKKLEMKNSEMVRKLKAKNENIIRLKTKVSNVRKTLQNLRKVGAINDIAYKALLTSCCHLREKRCSDDGEGKAVDYDADFIEIEIS